MESDFTPARGRGPRGSSSTSSNLTRDSSCTRAFSTFTRGPSCTRFRPVSSILTTGSAFTPVSSGTSSRSTSTSESSTMPSSTMPSTMPSTADSSAKKCASSSRILPSSCIQHDLFSFQRQKPPSKSSSHSSPSESSTPIVDEDTEIASYSSSAVGWCASAGASSAGTAGG